ncbi:MAG: Hsp33 family molecular chaperone HslO [Methylomonas sp.]
MNQQDCLIRFLFAELGVRGVWVRLQDSWLQAKKFQNLANADIETQLGEALAAVLLLSATIKFEGKMILQLQGSGELRTLVAQAGHDRTMRCLVRSADQVSAKNLNDMLGEGGRLVLTIEPENAEPYQGIVGVEEPKLADVLKTYFNQSEQLATCLWLFANNALAAGLFIQELPADKRDESSWRHLEILGDTVTADEMLSLDCEALLHRLFNEEKVIIYPAESVKFICGCSIKKIGGALLALGRSELESILAERENIEVDCQFCGARYRFDKIDVENLLTNSLIDEGDAPPTHH